MGQRVPLSPRQRLRISASEQEKHRINKNTTIRDRQAMSYKNRKEWSMILEVI